LGIRQPNSSLKRQFGAGAIIGGLVFCSVQIICCLGQEWNNNGSPQSIAISPVNVTQGFSYETLNGCDTQQGLGPAYAISHTWNLGNSSGGGRFGEQRRQRGSSDDTKVRRPEFPRAQIAAFGIILVHAYFGIEWDVVWRAAKNRCPVLRDQVAEMAE